MTLVKFLYQTLLFLSLAVMSLACGDNCSTIITFNARLTPRTANYSDRKDAIPQALLNEDADVLCLQEYWFEKDVKSMLDELQSTYPYHYSPIHYRVGDLRKPREEMDLEEEFSDLMFTDSSCSAAEILYFKSEVLVCAALEGCLSKSQRSIRKKATCITTRCESSLRSNLISADCISCIFIMAKSLTKALSACHEYPDLGTDNRFNTFGLVLLSKKPLNEVGYETYFYGNRFSVRRGYIIANIQDIGQIECTHTTHLYRHYVEYDLPLENYLEQLKREVKVLNHTFGTSDNISIGDLNMNPAADRTRSLHSHASRQVHLMGKIFQSNCNTFTTVLNLSSPFGRFDDYGHKAKVCPP